jgi:hypothetical protein
MMDFLAAGLQKGTNSFFVCCFIGHLFAFIVQKSRWGFRIWIGDPQQCWELKLIYEKCSVAWLSGELWSHRNHPDSGDRR